MEKYKKYSFSILMLCSYFSMFIIQCMKDLKSHKVTDIYMGILNVVECAWYVCVVGGGGDGCKKYLCSIPYIHPTTHIHT